MNTNQRLKHLQVQFFPAALIAEKSAIMLFFTPKQPVPDADKTGFASDGTDRRYLPGSRP
ncbi:hypothetical protein COO59_14920 [Mixta theicola]|uniref:Uncharacterized protein n=1 Tax=Mixta theicola TaxID=1458355 RepID=A0A2K1Q772_9GAMM|nr:hypothetical protein [Mixta theicola]PNS10903.1 hypothetical protein COO59_14920 [Mixta theicola]GLR11124.1 hypothetical protein GCM10007905_38440 [Mixta theicola]